MMTSISNRRKYKSKKSPSARPMTRTEIMLKELVESGKQQQIRPEPEVLDVPRIRIKRQKVYTFEFSCNKSSFATSTSVETDMSYFFSLSDLNVSSSLTTIFDTYRVFQVNLKFIPASAPSGVQGSMYSVLDYDDGSTTPVSTLLNYENLQVVPIPQYFERTVNPCAAKALYGGAFTQFGQDPHPWVDCANPGVYHYGIKVGSPIAAVAATTYTVVATYVIQFRNTR